MCVRLHRFALQLTQQLSDTAWIHHLTSTCLLHALSDIFCAHPISHATILQLDHCIAELPIAEGLSGGEVFVAPDESESMTRRLQRGLVTLLPQKRAHFSALQAPLNSAPRSATPHSPGFFC